MRNESILQIAIGALLAPAAALLATAATLLAPGPLHAQTFFAESEALRPDSRIALTFSDLTDDSSTESASTLDSSLTQSTLRRIDGRYRLSFFGFGGMAESREFQEDTDTFNERDDRDQSAGYLSLVFEDLMLDDDGLFLVLSSSTRTQDFTFDTFRRALQADVNYEAGIIYRLSVLVAGYIQGNERLDLIIEDPGGTDADEEYEFDFEAWIAGVVIGDIESYGLSIVAQKKTSPEVPGVNVTLEKGFQELKRALLGLGRFRVEYQETRFREAFTNDSFRDSKERDASVGVRITENFWFEATQKRISDAQGFTLLGVSSVDRTERTVNSVRLVLEF